MAKSVWTKHENLYIFAYIEKYPDMSAKDMAALINSQGFIDKQRGENAIYQHILALKKLQSDLVVPDPVHEFNKSEV